MTVTAATYGEAVKLPFYDFWDTGYAEKGGMICILCREIS